jgi:hypothetical protein
MKECGGVDVWIHVFLSSALVGDRVVLIKHRVNFTLFNLRFLNYHNIIYS